MRNSHKASSTFTDFYPTLERPYHETALRPSFLPLETHTISSFTNALAYENASPQLISEILHLFNGMKTCQTKAHFYKMHVGNEQQANAYHRTAQTLEAQLRLLLYDNFSA